MGVDSAGFVACITPLIRYHINLQQARAAEFIEIGDRDGVQDCGKGLGEVGGIGGIWLRVGE